MHNTLTLEQNEIRDRSQNLAETTVEHYDQLSLTENDRKEFAIKQYHVSVDSVVVTALSTGIAIWAMYVGQIIVTLLPQVQLGFRLTH